MEEDILYYFRVAAVNDVGIGPYSRSTAYTQRKACEYISPNIHCMCTTKPVHTCVGVDVHCHYAYYLACMRWGHNSGLAE